MWEDYCLVLETLEEKAPHLIHQVLGRVAALSSDSGASGDRRLHHADSVASGGRSLHHADSGASGGRRLHYSWLMVVFTRFFQHQNTIVIRQGLEAFLTTTTAAGGGGTDEELQLLADFLVTRLYNVLNESRIFSIEEDEQGDRKHFGETLRWVGTVTVTIYKSKLIN